MEAPEGTAARWRTPQKVFLLLASYWFYAGLDWVLLLILLGSSLGNYLAAEMLVRSGALDVLVVDSVAALVPKAEIEGEMGDSHMGLQARLMSQALRKLTGTISKSQTSVIFINQLRVLLVLGVLLVYAVMASQYESLRDPFIVMFSVPLAAIGVLLITGPLLLSQRGIALTQPSSWPHIVRLKLALVGVLLVLTVLHDLVLGPRVSHAVAIPEASRTAWEHVVVRTARWLPRVSLLLALAVVIAAGTIPLHALVLRQ